VNKSKIRFKDIFLVIVSRGEQATAESKSDISNIKAEVRNVSAGRKKHATKQ
jgi:hypothetical protein